MFCLASWSNVQGKAWCSLSVTAPRAFSDHVSSQTISLSVDFSSSCLNMKPQAVFKNKSLSSVHWRLTVCPLFPAAKSRYLKSKNTDLENHEGEKEMAVRCLWDRCCSSLAGKNTTHLKWADWFWLLSVWTSWICLVGRWLHQAKKTTDLHLLKTVKKCPKH